MKAVSIFTSIILTLLFVGTVGAQDTQFEDDFPTYEEYFEIITSDDTFYTGVQMVRGKIEFSESPSVNRFTQKQVLKREITTFDGKKELYDMVEFPYLKPEELIDLYLLATYLYVDWDVDFSEAVKYPYLDPIYSTLYQVPKYSFYISLDDSSLFTRELRRMIEYPEQMWWIETLGGSKPIGGDKRYSGIISDNDINQSYKVMSEFDLYSVIYYTEYQPGPSRKGELHLDRRTSSLYWKIFDLYADQ